MNIRTQRKEDLSLNLTPLIDVVFLLLIFFMVTTTFKQSTQLNLELPKASLEPQPIPVGIEIGIDALGVYTIQGKALSSNEPLVLKQALKAGLIELSENQSALNVIIKGDKQAPHQAVVTAMEIAGELGIMQLKIVANHQNS